MAFDKRHVPPGVPVPIALLQWLSSSYSILLQSLLVICVAAPFLGGCLVYPIQISSTIRALSVLQPFIGFMSQDEELGFRWCSLFDMAFLAPFAVPILGGSLVDLVQISSTFRDLSVLQNFIGFLSLDEEWLLRWCSTFDGVILALVAVSFLIFGGYLVYLIT